uniref:Secreted protein n=1 Tax=Glossina pallidipes TaxID=7398 RepID=A0A1B0ACM6_GLOPL
MYLIKVLITLAAAISTLKVNANESKEFNETLTIDTYIEFYKRQHSARIRNFKNRLRAFMSIYENKIELIREQERFLYYHRQFLESNLYTMEYLSGLNKHCIARYRGNVPSVTSIRQTMELCVEMAKDNSKNLLNNAQQTVDHLNEYYETTFLNAAAKIRTMKNDGLALLDDEVLKANEYVHEIKRRFDNDLESAEFQARAFTKLALNCSLSVHFDTAIALVEVKSKIQSCLKGQEFCTCKDTYACNNVKEVKPAVLSAKSIFTSNEVDSSKKSKTCILLKTETEHDLFNITRKPGQHEKPEKLPGSLSAHQIQGSQVLSSSNLPKQSFEPVTFSSSLLTQEIKKIEKPPMSLLAQESLHGSRFGQQNHDSEPARSSLLAQPSLHKSLLAKQSLPDPLLAKQSFPSSRLEKQNLLSPLPTHQTQKSKMLPSSPLTKQKKDSDSKVAGLPESDMEVAEIFWKSRFEQQRQAAESLWNSHGL